MTQVCELTHEYMQHDLEEISLQYILTDWRVINNMHDKLITIFQYVITYISVARDVLKRRHITLRKQLF